MMDAMTYVYIAPGSIQRLWIHKQRTHFSYDPKIRILCVAQRNVIEFTNLVLHALHVELFVVGLTIAFQGHASFDAFNSGINFACSRVSRGKPFGMCRENA
jgi:hypothetical protein